MIGQDHLDGYVLGAIALLTLCTFLTRAAYHLFGHRVPLSDGVRSALRYAPAAALTAIIVPILLPWGSSSPSLAIDERLFSALIAIWIFRKTRNNLVMIVGGMISFWMLRALFEIF